MGSIKDETGAPAEGSLRCETTEDEEHPGATGRSLATEEPQRSTGPNQDITQSRLMQNEVTIPPQSSADNVLCDLSARDEASDFQRKSREMDEGSENILSESSAPLSPVPCSPAPPGQHHIRTQVSLEVVQCHSVATSPMTPPQEDNSFFFPSSSGRSPEATKDAELQVGQQVEYRSVATAPMTPKTPTSSNFPELTEENTRGGMETGSKMEWTSVVKDTTAMDVPEATSCTSTTASPKSSADCPPIESRKQSKQHTQKMGSMDQDITILVTHHDNTLESEEEGFLRSIELEVKIDECDEISAPSTEESPMDEVTANTNEGKNFDSRHEREAPKTETQIKIKCASSSLPISEPLQTAKKTLAKDKQSTRSEVKAKENESFGEELEKVSQPESPMTPNPVPSSPAPSGFQHIRTQVSLEVVQCHSVATSPMTPPQGDNAFFFPTSSGHSGATGPETKDAELQAGRQVEYRSIATAPMTPKTPTSATFPEISRKETEQMGENTRGGVEPGWTGHVPQPPQDDSAVIKSATDSVNNTTGTDVPEAASCISTTASPKSSIDCPPVGLVDSQATPQDGRKQSKQHTQKMGSMDQDITILVTHHDNTLADSEEGGLHTDSSLRSIELEVKIDECNEIHAPSTEAGGEAMNTERGQKQEAPTDVGPTANTNEGKNFDSGHEQEAQTTHIKIKCASSSLPISEPLETAKDTLAKDKQSTRSEVKAKENESFGVELEKVSQPESPMSSPFQHIRTQVSLEVVQCHSVATSPMTPPQGDNAFFFPTSPGRCGATGPETIYHKPQAGRSVEYRSVATGPMTPRTPTAPSSFQEIRPEKRVEERIAEGEQHKDKKESTSTATVVEGKEEAERSREDKVKAEEDRKVEAAAGKPTTTASKEKCEEKCEEPVQKVNWDEKGMTWEVYGAVVEVAVLGSAIQKHLEKQVKKHRNQPSMPPPPPLIPTAVPLTSASPSASASGKRGSRKGRAGKRGERDGKPGRRSRQNPFRLLMRNMQQPICCSRAHAAE